MLNLIPVPLDVVEQLEEQTQSLQRLDNGENLFEGQCCAGGMLDESQAQGLKSMGQASASKHKFL
jgi:hypothetical protein